MLGFLFMATIITSNMEFVPSMKDNPLNRGSFAHQVSDTNLTLILCNNGIDAPSIKFQPEEDLNEDTTVITTQFKEEGIERESFIPTLSPTIATDTSCFSADPVWDYSVVSLKVNGISGKIHYARVGYTITISHTWYYNKYGYCPFCNAQVYVGIAGIDSYTSCSGDFPNSYVGNIYLTFTTTISNYGCLTIFRTNNLDNQCDHIYSGQEIGKIFIQAIPTNEAMCDLAAGLGGVNGWTCSSGVPTARSICVGSTSNWAGVTCDSASNIIRIVKDDSSLSGTLSTTIGYLSSLTYLSLHSNNIAGRLPTTIGQLTSLQYLSLAANCMSGSIPTEIGYLSSLTYLDLYQNELTNSIPTAIGLMTSLQHLVIYRNCISGTIPSTFGYLISLSYFDLSLNNIAGRLPTTIGQLTSLQYLSLAANYITGAIPTEIGYLSSLTYFDLYQNKLVDSIPTAIGLMTSLKHLALSSNYLSGTIPSTFGYLSSLSFLSLYSNNIAGRLPTTIGQLTSLQYLSLSYNYFSGSIPTEIGYLSSLTYLDLYQNILVDSIPTAIGLMTSLQDLAIASNCLSGTIPTAIGLMTSLYFLDLAYNCLSGYIPTTIGFLTSLHYLYLFNNFLSGSIPTAIGLMSSLKDLQLYYNNISGSIPTTIGFLTSLQYLIIYYNNISGSIPTTIGFLTSLQYLYPDNNFLSGSIPTAIGLMSSLKDAILYYNCLSGSIPTEVGFLVSLRYISLKYNKLRGSIPTAIGLMTSLKNLVLYVNCLSGTIPTDIGLMKSLEYLALRLNSLSGSIPTAIGLVTSLTYLDCNNNKLTGSIPPTIGLLSSLGYLSLWHNSLSGSIPTAIGLMTSLTYLDWNNNKLRGSIPIAIGFMASLQYLLIWNNCLSGTIPTAIETMSSLMTVALSVNSVSGSIPTTIGQLASLQYLSLAANYITGAIPTEIGYLSSLTYLDLYQNKLANSIPTAIGFLASLQYLLIWNNCLSGTIPTAIGTMSSLMTLALSVNCVSGSIPTTIGLMTSLTGLFIDNNKLTGTAPLQLCLLAKLAVVYLYTNNLIACSSICTIGDDFANCISAPTTIPSSRPTRFRSAYPTYVPVEYVAKSPSVIPSASTESQTNAMCDIAAATSISNIVSNGWSCNSGTSTTSICSWVGVYCDSYSQVVSIDLSVLQGISGTISNSIRYLKSLISLRLGYNSFSDSIPTGLGVLSQLTYLNVSYNQLSGPLPSEIGKTPLRKLIINNNYLTGSIPSGLCNDPYLTYLSSELNAFSCYSACLSYLMCNTSLISCSSAPSAIPAMEPTIVPSNSPVRKPTSTPTTAPTAASEIVLCELAKSFNITSLVHKGWRCIDGSPLSNVCKWSGVKCSASNKTIQLDISGYSATGTIPNSIGDLHSLTSIDISSNSITGTIPFTVSYLTNLRSLKLQNNLLKSILPTAMVAMKSLKELNIMTNDLTGTIPTSFGSSLTALIVLNLQNNQLVGTIPSNLLTGNLQELYLNDNKLSGGFPYLDASTTNIVGSSTGYILTGPSSSSSIEINNQRKYLKHYVRRKIATVSIGSLNTLYLSGNSLMGTIPSSITYITGLQSLYLFNNQFTGTLCPDFGKLNKLQHLDVSENRISGTLYGSVTGSSLLSLDVSDNRFTGIVPLSLCDKSLTLLDFRNNTNMTCFSNCLTKITKLYSGIIHTCNNTSPPVSNGTGSSITPTTIGLIVMGAVLLFLSIGGFLYYQRKIRKKIIFKFHEHSRNIDFVKLEDGVIKPLHDDYNLFRGNLKMKEKEEFIPIDVIIGKNRNKLHEEYEALFNLRESNNTHFAPLYGFVKEKKLSLVSGASVSGLSGIAVGRSKTSIDNYLSSQDDRPVRKSLRVKQAHIGSTLINITNEAIKQNVVLFGLNLNDLMYYDEDDSIKLFFTRDVYEVGSRFPDAYVGSVISYNQTTSIDSLRGEETMTVVATKVNIAELTVSTQYSVIFQLHALWILGTLLFELFVGRSLQDILCPISNDSYSSALFSLKQSDMDNLIDKHCSGAKYYLRREILKILLQIQVDGHKLNRLDIRSYLKRNNNMLDLDNIELINADTYMENTSDSTIFFFIEKNVPEEILIRLLEENPKLSSVINSNGLLPIQFALEKSSYPGLLVKLIELYPASLKVLFPPSIEGKVGDNLIIRAMNLSLSDDHIRVLLPHYMPIDLEGHALPVVDHQFAWTKLVQYDKNPDFYVETVKLTLQKFQKHVKELAICVDELSRPALNVATPLCKAEIVKILYFLGRYEFKAGIAHQSATCTVRLAIDTVVNRDVALKFMKHRDQFEREINTRRKGRFDEDYVIGYLDALDGDQDPLLREELNLKGFGAYSYCLIMMEADRSMHAMIAHEHIAGKDWDQIRVLCTQLIKAAHHIHSRGMIHGDIKPLNIMRANGKMVLIDLDACVSYEEGDLVGVKFSSAYIPPEMIYIDETEITLQPKIKSYCPLVVNGKPLTADFQFTFELLQASRSYDMWSLGVTLFQLCSGKPLFFADNEDNISGETLIELYEWTERYKYFKLMEVTDPLARNLLSQLLHKNPECRITTERTLNHSFLTGKKATRMIGEEPEYDLFISYRVAADAAHVERLYNMLTSRNITVWWDKICLEPGKPWEEGFCNGLAKSRAFVPIMSREALKSRKSPNRQNLENLNDDSACDNVLLEYRLALEMRAMGLIELIFPVMIGDKNENNNIYSNYFSSVCHPTCKSVSVYSVEEKVREHLDRQGLGAPFSGVTTIDTVLSKLLENQGEFIEGPAEEAFDKVATLIESMIRKSKLKSLATKSSSKSITVELDGLEEHELEGIKLEISNIVRRMSGSK